MGRCAMCGFVRVDVPDSFGSAGEAIARPFAGSLTRRCSAIIARLSRRRLLPNPRYGPLYPEARFVVRPIFFRHRHNRSSTGALTVQKPFGGEDGGNTDGSSTRSESGSLFRVSTPAQAERYCAGKAPPSLIPEGNAPHRLGYDGGQCSWPWSLCARTARGSPQGGSGARGSGYCGHNSTARTSRWHWPPRVTSLAADCRMPPGGHKGRASTDTGSTRSDECFARAQLRRGTRWPRTGTRMSSPTTSRTSHSTEQRGAGSTVWRSGA